MARTLHQALLIYPSKPGMMPFLPWPECWPCKTRRRMRQNGSKKDFCYLSMKSKRQMLLRQHCRIQEKAGKLYDRLYLKIWMILKSRKGWITNSPEKKSPTAHIEKGGAQIFRFMKACIQKKGRQNIENQQRNNPCNDTNFFIIPPRLRLRVGNLWKSQHTQTKKIVNTGRTSVSYLLPQRVTWPPKP